MTIERPMFPQTRRAFVNTIAALPIAAAAPAATAQILDAVAQKLEHEKIAGKYFVTLSAIEEMRTSCRVPAKAPDLPSKKREADNQPGSSKTASEPSALDAMNAIAEGLKQSLQPTSSKSTTPKKPSATVIRMGSR